MKKLNIHADYTLWLLLVQLKSQLNIVCAYMQNTTPYGDEYKTCLNTIGSIEEQIKKLENDLQECLEIRGK